MIFIDGSVQIVFMNHGIRKKFDGHDAVDSDIAQISHHLFDDLSPSKPLTTEQIRDFHRLDYNTLHGLFYSQSYLEATGESFLRYDTDVSHDEHVVYTLASPNNALASIIQEIKRSHNYYFYLYNPKYNKSIWVDFKDLQTIRRKR